MAVSGVSQSVSLLSAYGQQAQGNDAQKSEQVSQQQNNVAAQTALSNFGQVKNALSDLQAGAKAVKASSNAPASSDFKAAVQNLVQTYNTLNRLVQAPQDAKGNAAASDARSTQALRDVSNALSSSGNPTALQSPGLEKQKDGSLSVNQAAFDKALRENPATVSGEYGAAADRIGQAVDRQLTGNLVNGTRPQEASTIEREQESARKTAQDKQDALRLQQQQLAAQLQGASTATAKTAVNRYFSVATL